MRIIVLIFIWGGFIYFLLYGLPGSGFNGITDNGFLSPVQEGIIGIFDQEGNFQNAVVHFNKKIDISDIKVSPGDSKSIFIGSDKGLFVSQDGGLNWYNFSDAEHKIDSNTKIYKILFNHPQSSAADSNQVFISVLQNKKGVIYKSEDKFFSLEKILELDNEIIYDFAINGQNLYLGLSDGKLIIYSLVNKEFRTLTKLDSAITNLQINRDGNLIYLTLKSGGLWVSGNNGQSFGWINVGGADKIYSFSLSSKNNSLIYAVTDKGLAQSSDAGTSWQILKSLPSENSSKVSALALIPNPGEIFAASNGNIYKSNNHGLSWQILDPEFGNREISIIEPNNDKIIVGTKR